jgi:hypothetical protein
MFGKKKDDAIKVMHYEGIQEFAADYPCTLGVKGDTLEIKRIKPETTITLPLNRISSFSAMDEKNFMLKYNGQAAKTSKSGIGKYYLVVNYDKGMLVFWGTAKEYRKFIDLQNNGVSAPSSIEL